MYLLLLEYLYSIKIFLSGTFPLMIDVCSQDISEATEFRPLLSSSVDVATKRELCIFALKIHFRQISATLFSKYSALSYVQRHFMRIIC